MLEEDDLSFYRRRLAEELALEGGATNAAVKSSHRLLAEIYRGHIGDLARNQTPSEAAGSVERERV